MSEKSSDPSLLSKIASYTEILAKDPKSTVFVPLAETYRQMGMLGDALEVAECGIQAMPRFSPGYTVLGRIHAQRKELTAALTAFEKALDIDNDSLVTLKSMAKVLVQTGKKQRASELLQRALVISPEDAGARQMFQALGGEPPSQPQQGKTEPVPQRSAEPRQPAAARKIRDNDEEQGLETVDPITTATIANIYIKQGFPRRAMKVYRDLLKADPHNADIRRRLVALKRQLEEEEESVEPVAEMPPTPAVVEAGPEASPSAQAEAFDGEISETADAADLTAAPAVIEAAENTQAPVGAIDIVASQVAALQRWLDAIAMRRAHV